MSFKAINHVLEEYKKARLSFAYDICEFASWQSSTKYLEGTDIIELLAPLISDKNIKIKKRAILSAGKLAEKSPLLAKRMIDSNQFASLLKDVYNFDISIRKTKIFFIKGVSRHNAQLASDIVRLGVIPDLVISLEDFDLEVKRDAVAALGNIGKHSETLSKTVIDSGALQLFISCFLQPDISLQQNVMKAFEDLSQYRAEDIVAIGGLYQVVKAADSNNVKLKASALKTLALIADTSEELAGFVVDSGAMSVVVGSSTVASAFVIRNITKHSPELAQKAVDAGACELLVQLLNAKESVIVNSSLSASSLTHSTKSSSSQQSLKKNIPEQPHAVDAVSQKRSCISLGGKGTQQTNEKYSLAPVAETLGHIAKHSPLLAMDVISSKGVVPLVKILCDSVRMSSGKMFCCDYNDHLSTLCSTVWALGQIAQHSPEHSESVAAAGTLPLLIQLWQNCCETEEVSTQIEQTFGLCLKHCVYRPALEPMLHLAPAKLLKPVLVQYSKILPHDAKARRLFVTTGALQKIQELSKSLGSEGECLISTINACFPDEILKYCSPDFVNTLLEHVDNFLPQINDTATSETS